MRIVDVDRRREAVISRKPFIINVQSDNTGTSNTNQFTIPTYGSGYGYNVKTSDGQIINNNSGDLTISFPSVGNYDIEISGSFPRIYFNNSGDKLKLLDIKQWGDIQWTSFADSFYGCDNLTGSFADAPNLQNVTTLRRMFRACSSFNSTNLGRWDISGITDIFEMFFGATSFNSDISNWDTSNVENMGSALRYATSFNIDISSWNVENVTNFFSFMFGKTSYDYLDNIYNSWSQQQVNSNLDISFGDITYTSAGQSGKDTLINTYNWTISDGGQI